MAQSSERNEKSNNKPAGGAQDVRVKRRGDNRTDWRPVANIAGKPTLSEDFIQSSSERVTDPRVEHEKSNSNVQDGTQNVVVSRAQEEKSKVSQKRIRKIREEFTKERTRGVPIKGIAKRTRKKRARKATLIAVATCMPWYGVQIGWWIFSLIGLGIEGGASAREIFGLSFVEGIIAWATSAILPGQTIFLIGWLISSLFGLVQVAQTFVIYKINRVNPIRGEAFPSLGIVIALYMMPLGLFFWVGLWMFSVIKNAGEK